MMHWDFGGGWPWLLILWGTFYALVIAIVVLAAKTAVHDGKRQRLSIRSRDL